MRLSNLPKVMDSKWQSWATSSGGLAIQPVLLTTTIHCLSYVVGTDKCLLIEMIRSVTKGKERVSKSTVSQPQLSYAAVTNNPKISAYRKRLHANGRSAMVLLCIRDAG